VVTEDKENPPATPERATTVMSVATPGAGTPVAAGTASEDDGIDLGSTYAKSLGYVVMEATPDAGAGVGISKESR